MCMQPSLYIDYNFMIMHDGSIKFDEELSPISIDLKNGDIFVAYVSSGSIFLRKYRPLSS